MKPLERLVHWIVGALVFVLVFVLYETGGLILRFQERRKR